MLVTSAPPVAAAELVMFESAGCPWCMQWNEEIGAIYPKSDEGKMLPLRRVDVKGTIPEDLAKIGGIVYTPTFVVVEKGAEVGRIQGYPGEENFWWMLGNLIARLQSLQQAALPRR